MIKRLITHETEPQTKNVLRLGMVSLLNDLSSEVLTRLVPLFVSSVLGAPMSAVGAVEGIAEATATLLKPAFGALSDRLGRRKTFVTLGYALSVFARPFLAFCGSWVQVASFRVVDRVGKGVRTGARDALIADSTLHRKHHGRSFGINRSLDTLGALLGILAFAGWILWKGESQLTRATWTQLCFAGSLPGVIAVGLVIFGIREVGRPAAQPSAAQPAGAGNAAARERLDPVLKRYLLLIALFSLANSSDAFILLKARELGYTLPAILGLIALLNLVSAMTAIPASILSDRVGRRTLLVAGWIVYGLTYAAIGLGAATRGTLVFACVTSTYGLFFGFTESVEKAFIADLAPPQARGRAYGLLGLVTGLSALPASFLFGWVWDHYGSEVPFLIDAGVAFAAAALLHFMMPASSPTPPRTSPA